VVIVGVPPLKLRFSMLNHKYFISAFSTGRHSFLRLLAVLSGLKSIEIVREFGMVDDYDLEPVHSVYDDPVEVCSMSTMWWSRN
jgi:hypothetical protein